MANRIKELRQQLNMTLLDVAEKLGVSEGTVQRYESGNIKNLKYDTMVSLAEIFGCTPAYLMGWDDQDQTSGQQNGYYIDPETVEKIHEIYEVPELRIIFDAKRDLSPEDLEFVVKTIGILKGSNNDD